MGRRTPPHKSNPHITEAKFRSMIISALRNSSRWWKPALEAKEEACVGVRINKKTGKKAKHYKCAKCKRLFVSNDVDIDHIDSIIDPQVGFVSWDVFIAKLFAPKEAYQILCKKCHKDKTLKERQLKKHYEEQAKNNPPKGKGNC